MKKLWVVTLTAVLLLAQPLAEAKRLGGAARSAASPAT